MRLQLLHMYPRVLSLQASCPPREPVALYLDQAGREKGEREKGSLER
jgi:hypothetical protein